MVASELARMVRVVAVSPSDVQAERDRLEMVVDELNRGCCAERGCRLSLWGSDHKFAWDNAKH
jgi:hypothetical protein